MNELIEYLEKELRRRILFEQKDMTGLDPLDYRYSEHLGALRAYYIILGLVAKWKNQND